MVIRSRRLSRFVVRVLVASSIVEGLGGLESLIDGVKLLNQLSISEFIVSKDGKRIFLAELSSKFFFQRVLIELEGPSDTCEFRMVSMKRPAALV